MARAPAVLIDTKPLLLLVVGTYDRTRIAHFKRTSTFSESDFDLLLGLLANFGSLITTPNVLSEVSNFLGQLTDPVKTAAFYYLRSQIGVVREEYVSSRTAATDSAFARLGLTDAGLIHLAGAQLPVLTDDLDLYLELSGRGGVVYYFTHFRFP